MDMLLKSAEVLIENAIVNVNMEKINLYWNMGKLVNDYKIRNNSKHGDGVVKKFCEILSLKYGKGFNKSNIEKMCLFYQVFKNASARRHSMKSLSDIVAMWPQSENYWPYANKYKNISCLVSY